MDNLICKESVENMKHYKIHKKSFRQSLSVINTDLNLYLYNIEAPRGLIIYINNIKETHICKSCKSIFTVGEKEGYNDEEYNCKSCKK